MVNTASDGSAMLRGVSFALGTMIAGLVGLLGAAFVLERRDRSDPVRELRFVQFDDASRARDGDVVKIALQLDPDHPEIESPLHGRRCIAWTLTVHETTAAGPMVHEEKSIGVLRGTSGGVRVVIEPGKATIVSFGEPGFQAPPTDAVRALLATSGRPPRKDERLGCEEDTLASGARVTAMGRAEWRASTDLADYRDTTRELVLRGDDAHPLLLSSRPRHLLESAAWAPAELDSTGPRRRG